MSTFLPSLIDRLIDDAPELAVDQPRTRSDDLRRTREGFRRDLEALLNTRRICTSVPKSYVAMQSALPNYGVDDFVGAAMATPAQRADLAERLKQAILTFEPRFSDVAVTIVRSRDPFERLVRIHIQAVARHGATPEPLAFTMALDPAIRRFSIEDRGDG